MTRNVVASVVGVVVAVVVLVLAACGCPTRVPPVDMSNLTDATADARVHQAAARRARMAGTVKAKLPGLQGAVMSADLDVAVEPPAKLSVAVRSFFEQPQQMLVTDGNVVTIYDATSGQPVFKRGPVDSKAVAKVLPIPLSPAEVVAVFLAKPPDDVHGHLVGVDEKAGTYDVAYDMNERVGPFTVTVRAADDAIVHWQQARRDGTRLLEVTYRDLRNVGDAVMPFGWGLVVVDTKDALDFVATDVTFNGEPLPDDAFKLDPPPNVPLLPL